MALHYTVLDTRGKHINVLQHLMGYLKNHLSGQETGPMLVRAGFGDVRWRIATSVAWSPGGGCQH